MDYYEYQKYKTKYLAINNNQTGGGKKELQ